MILPLIKKGAGIKIEKQCHSHHTRLVQTQSEKDGVFVTECYYEIYDPKDEMDKFTSLDFQIANLQAIGATEMLQQMPMISTSTLSTLDNIENTIKVENNVQ